MKKFMFLVLFAMIGTGFNSISAAADAAVDTHQYVKGDKIKIGTKSYKIIDVNNDIITVAWDKKTNRSFKILTSNSLDKLDDNLDYLNWSPITKGYVIRAEKYRSTVNIHPGDKITLTLRSFKVISVDEDTIIIDQSILPWEKKKYRSYKVWKGEPMQRGVWYLLAVDNKKFAPINYRYGV